MAVNLDTYLGIHTDALRVQSRRMELLADNLANADTPNYKARDIDFRAALASIGGTQGGTQGGVSLSGTHTNHLGTEALGENSPVIKYRVPLAPALDGNTVDSQLEQAAFAENSVRYQATLTFISSRLRNLMTAITGS